MEHESSGSAPRISGIHVLAAAAAALVGLAGYVAASARVYRMGFPLDDSWIHATYARNLAFHHQWAFRLGQPSAGSTAPLWTFLLVPGFWLEAAPLWWSLLLGFLTLLVLGLAVESTVRRLIAGYRPTIPWIGLFTILEWHMLWAAASGMETLLYAALATIILSMVLTGSRNRAALGLLTGLSLWLRPDAITLAAAVIVNILVSPGDGASRVRGLVTYLVAFGSLLLPYLAFNLWLSGTPMPNTFYAKQAEYVAWQARPLLSRLGQGLLQLSVGPMLLLWPGLAICTVKILRTRNMAMGVVLAWSSLYALMYVMRLPAYQHGRYLMPVLPLLVVLGFVGFLDFRDSRQVGRTHRSLIWAWQSGLALLSIGFIVLGARAYAEDVAIIESEMVNTAQWVSSALPPEAVIAAHDIGALGYFDDHTLVDLAGLVSPEVVPILRDQDRLAEMLDARGADYLISFPGVYPKLVALSRPVHASGGAFAPAAGEGNMTVYCWRCR